MDPVGLIADGLGKVLDLIGNTVDAVMDNLPGGEMEVTPAKHYNPRTLFSLDKKKKDLSNATTQKAISPTFTASIRVAAQSEDETKRKVAAQAISTSLRELAGDNELIDSAFLFPKHTINQINNRQMPIIRFGKTVLSTAEVGSLMRIPTGPLQEQFPGS